MNSTFKVVFNKARGALMVVNEVTSSVQGKGTKTVVAAAVATMLAGVAGSTMAAEWVEAPRPPLLIGSLTRTPTTSRRRIPKPPEPSSAPPKRTRPSRSTSLFG